MPVKIQIGDNSDDPRVIDLQEYYDGRDNFHLHYYYTSAEAAFGGQVVDIPWSGLQQAVEQYITATSTQPDDVALRFVHCFEPAPAGHLFLRMQICKLVPSQEPPPPGASQVYNLDTTGSMWYELKNGAINPTSDEALEGIVYLENFYYKTEPQSAEMQCLIDGPDKYVKNLVLPWGLEILEMYMQNGQPDGGGVHFAACSYTTTPEYANVMWPHGMVIYLSNSEGVPLLDNGNYLTIFHNKGADMSTLCPPHCGVYIAPDI